MLLLSGCMVENEPEVSSSTVSTTSFTTSTLEPGTCNNAGDCQTYCINTKNCTQYTYYHIETECVDGGCRCVCVSDELPPVLSPQGDEFTYRDKTYQKTSIIMICGGDLTVVGNYTIWSDSINGYIYTAQEINIAEDRFMCYRWFEKPGVIVKSYTDRAKQGGSYGFDVINVDVVERTIEPPYFLVQRVFEGNLTDIDMLEGPCGEQASQQEPIILKPENRKVFEWNTKIEYCNGSNPISESAPPGTYRVKIFLENGELTYSDEFTLEPNVIIDIKTDKKDYRSQELIKMSVELESKGFLNNVSLRIFGISGQSGSLNIRKDFDLDAGNQTLRFNYLIPSCSSGECSSIEPGSYNVRALLYYEGESISSDSTKVNIEP
ncbi:MAG: hypothetical protein B6U97_01330 [Candidatus Altiarchaeales archaeon ex4484_96]|nr:MAG: hypothetical protein B6U97_01330 [Candidatus Altiarchaeales archaeon ex4484_96]